MGKIKTKKRVHRNPLRAIRAKCLECCGGSPKEVRLCSDVSCALHPFRKGQNPFVRCKKGKVAASLAKDQRKAGPRETQLSLLSS
ncbi:MAG TPA: hypothetical protein ENN39_05550 [Desulfonatronum sp.]|nr:hypothetical protein [Desulfonatronum sp.]